MFVKLLLYLNNVAGADIGAVSALYALGNIDLGQIVFDDDCVCRAFLLALHAANTACFANLHHLCALVHAAACYEHVLVIRNELDNLLGAGISTSTTADALFAVNLCHAVNDIHCTELAGIDTVAEAYAGKAAVHIALAAEQHCGLAVLGSLIVEALESMTFCTGAGNKCYHLLSITCGNSHDFANGGSCCCAAGNTLVNRCFALCNCCCIAITAGISAAAAVCTGKAFTYCFLLGVYFNIENFGCICKNCTENSTHNTEDNDTNYNCCNIHIFALLNRRCSCR